MQRQTGGLTLSSKRDLSLLVVIVLAAAFFRLWRLGEIPPGLCLDSAFTGLGAARILRGEFPIYFEATWGGTEPLYMYVLAPFLSLLGMTPLALKFVSAVVGIITVPILYLLTRELLGSRNVALLASAWLALSYWHLNYSRMGREIVLVPLLVMITLWLLLRGLRTGHWPDLVWAGISLGVSLYNYQPMRFLPILIVVYLGCRCVMDEAFRKKHRLKLLLPLLVALLVFAPLASYFVNNTEMFFMSARNVSIFGPELNEGSPLRALGRNTVQTMAAFIVLPDLNARQNPAGRPLLDPVSGLFFVVGLGMTIVKWRQPHHLLILVWLLVMSLPAILAVPVPHSARSIGVLPLACILPAIGLDEGLRWMRRRGPSQKTLRVSLLVLGMVLLFVALSSWVDYFTVWGAEDLDTAFDVPFADAAEAMNNSSSPGRVWILPLTPLAEPDTVHETVEFLYQGPAPHYYLRVDEETVAEELTVLARGHDQASVIEWDESALDGGSLYHGDPKGVLSFLLTKYGEELERQKFPAFDVVSYRLPAAPDFALARHFSSGSVSFDNQLVLTGVAYGGSSQDATSMPSEVEAELLPSGKSAWVALKWEASAPLSEDYKAGVYLVDGRGRLLAQMDKLLLSNDLHTTSEWPPGQVAMDYYTLLCPPATPPGLYYIEVGVYEPETMNRLPVLAEEGNTIGHSYRAGTVEVVKPLVPPVVEPQVRVSGAELAPGIRLLGYDSPLREIQPGDTIHAALYWQALRRVQDDYLLTLQLRDESGEVWAEQVDDPVDGTYPTTRWDDGEVLRDWHDLRVPAAAVEGTYEVCLRVTDGETVVGTLDLGEVEVKGRPHHFTVPRIRHPMDIMFGDSVGLVGYDLQSQQVRPGDVLQLTLYWKGVGDMDVSYTVFTHLLDADQRMWAQKDSVPGNGLAPTNSWVLGEVITDVYELDVDPNAPPGDYVLEMGMYDAATGQRLQVYDLAGAAVGDRVLSERIVVLP